MVLGLKKINQKRQAKKFIKKKLQLPTSILLKGKKNQIGYFKNLPSTGYVLPEYYQITPATTDGLFLLATTNCTFFTTAQQHFLPFPNSLWKNVYCSFYYFILGLSLTKHLHVLTRISKILILGKSHWIASP